MGIFEKLFKKQSSAMNVTPEAEEQLPPLLADALVEDSKIQRHYITGTAYYQDNIMKLAIQNPVFLLTPKELIKAGRENENIPRYIFSPVKTELIPEPTNPHDSKAIKVVVDGEHVGYIKKGSCGRLLKLINKDGIKKIDCFILGGEKKWVSVWDDEGHYSTGQDKSDFRVKITIYEK
jgi:hypothetical protein